MASEDFGRCTRRSLLTGAAAMGGLAASGHLASAAQPVLTVGTRQIEVKGRLANVFGVTGSRGTANFFWREGDTLSGPLWNDTPEPLVMHWHGQVHAAADQDRSRPDGGALAPGASDVVDFKLTPGTHWMHAHQLSEQQLLAAPMVTREADAPSVQEIVIMLHDFAFRSPAEILKELGGLDAHAGHGAPPSIEGGLAGHGGVAAPAKIHANDVRYDAFLANDRTLDDPEVVRVERGSNVRLRIINGATATAFFLDVGSLGAQCIAVDGAKCVPYPSKKFPIAQGQRIDLIVAIPPAGGAFPILAQVEADLACTGLVLATPGASIQRLASFADAASGYVDAILDMSLSAANSLPTKRPERVFQVLLGEQPNYVWTINGGVYGRNEPLRARVGERIELMFMNPTSMMHPMHLHGHHFQVVDIGGRRITGPVRDTVIVPPHTPVTVAFDADKVGQWFIHCHHLYHMATGMMAVLDVSA